MIDFYNFNELKKIRKEALFKECFINDSNCSKSIIKAHSIQNNRYLTRLIENNDTILTFNHADYDLQLNRKPREVGRKQASTFTGFCKKHDLEIFTPIENSDYKDGNKEQEFFFAFRALAWFLYFKTHKLNFSYLIIDRMNKGNLSFINNFEHLNDDQIKKIEQNYLINIAELQIEVNEKRDLLEKMKFDIDNQRFNTLKTVNIEFDKQYKIVGTSLVNPVFDLTYRMINDYSNPNVTLKPIFMSVLPQHESINVLISYFKADKALMKGFIDQIVSEDASIQKLIVSNIILQYFTNWYISKNYFDSIPHRSNIVDYYNNTDDNLWREWKWSYSPKLNLFY